MYKPKLSVKPKTIISKLDKAMAGLEDVMGYLKSKKHDQEIINIRQLFPTFCRLSDAKEAYQKLDKK